MLAFVSGSHSAMTLMWAGPPYSMLTERALEGGREGGRERGREGGREEGGGRDNINSLSSQTDVVLIESNRPTGQVTVPPQDHRNSSNTTHVV